LSKQRLAGGRIKEHKVSKKAFEKIAAGLSDAIGFAEGSVDPSDFRVHVPNMLT
jgi:hypothetical protein